MADTNDDRRRFLSICTNALLLILGGLLAIPGLGYVLGPIRGRSSAGGDGNLGDFTEVGALADLPIGTWKLLSLEVVQQDGWEQSKQKHAVWVRRNSTSEGDISVLSPICTHLGCPVDWHPERSEFVCPCHGGVFGQEGRLVSGPPPRSMDPLEFEVRDGKVMVRWQDFKIGVSVPVPVKL